MRCVTVLYPYQDGVRFDHDYYVKHHVKLIMDRYGSAIKKYEARKGLMQPDGSKPLYVMVGSIWYEDQATFDAAGAKHSAEVVADVPNFTNVMPLIQIDEAML